MKTRYTEHRQHPVDLLERFNGRLAVFDIASCATLEFAEFGHDCTATQQMFAEGDLARGIRELYQDFQDVRAAVKEWCEQRKEEGGAA